MHWRFVGGCLSALSDPKDQVGSRTEWCVLLLPESVLTSCCPSSPRSVWCAVLLEALQHLPSPRVALHHSPKWPQAHYPDVCGQEILWKIGVVPPKGHHPAVQTKWRVMRSMSACTVSCITLIPKGHMQGSCLWTFASTRLSALVSPRVCVRFPLLFSFYTNDCTSEDHSVKLLKYVDETTVTGLNQNTDESAYTQELGTVNGVVRTI